jgi:RNA polymerase sigma-70 factor (ECF subfamily)
MSPAVTTPRSVPISVALEPSERGFDVLYEQHFDFVFRCLLRLGVAPAHAEDAAQDVFIVLHRRLADLRPDASERGFLFAIASRVARDHRRKQARHSGVSLSDDTPARAGTGNPFEAAAQAQAARLLEHFLATLDEEQRAVFMLIELEGLSAPEIAHALSIKLNTVYSRLRLARERFMRFLSKQEPSP